MIEDNEYRLKVSYGRVIVLLVAVIMAGVLMFFGKNAESNRTLPSWALFLIGLPIVLLECRSAKLCKDAFVLKYLGIPVKKVPWNKIAGVHKILWRKSGINQGRGEYIILVEFGQSTLSNELSQLEPGSRRLQNRISGYALSHPLNIFLYYPAQKDVDKHMNALYSFRTQEGT